MISYFKIKERGEKLLNEISQKYLHKDFDRIYREVEGADSHEFYYNDKFNVLKDIFIKHNISVPDEESDKIIKKINKIDALLVNSRFELLHLGDKQNELEKKSRKEILKLTGVRDYRKNLQEEEINALENIKLIEPLEDIRKIHEKGYTGKGITIVILDTGIFPHPDFKGRIKVFKDFANKQEDLSDSCYDYDGHGTHVAGIAAGSGEASGGKFKGIAPDADLIVLNIINKETGTGKPDVLNKALKWVNENKEKYNIKIINTSISDMNDASWKLIKDEANKLLDKDIVWVSSAGNAGMDDDIVSTFSQWGKYSWSDRKPNLLAPGSNIIAPLALNSRTERVYKNYSVDINSDGKKDHVFMSGSSSVIF